jgi:putative ABC transport system permease protein
MMNTRVLVWNYLRARPLNTVLNILLLGLGVGVITVLMLFNRQFREQVTTNSRGIDLVVGAKGSPMQLILSSIFHVDFPTGNIRLHEAERIARNRLVKNAIPLALGDSYGGYRIVGTSHSYAALYDAALKEGALWGRPMEVTIGSAVAQSLDLSTGETFASNHGLSAAGQAHADHEFVVAGVFRPTNSVLDNLILTAVESVWQTHEAHAGDRPVVQGNIASPLIPSVAVGDSTKEITTLLIQYRSGMGAIQLPRLVNARSSLQAASPAFETARLFSLVGTGIDILEGFASMIIFISALSIFIALYNSLKERKYDLAIMRSMGASRSKIFLSVILEGAALTLLGTAFGMMLGHAAVFIFALVTEGAARSGFSAMILYPEEGIILAGGLFLGILCALLPALQAYRTDISKVLASR